MTRRVHPGDIGLYSIVWPTPRTMTAPTICYRQPRCVVLAVCWPYAIIKPQPRRGATDGGPRYRVHVDNLRCTDPGQRRAVLPGVRRTPPAPTTADVVQQRLF
ncbi:hypothetical protein [Dactylosporangium sp. NPDC000521]|uniref:hypothetical protein n=1 Tax=Dactylosporangium sp. NPDC000521 TaxID=3363975 RepID=UPI0036BEDDCC